MFNIGPEELILILVIALIFLGPAKLPEVARQIGKGLREFRSLSSRAQDELLETVSFDLTDAPDGTADPSEEANGSSVIASNGRSNGPKEAMETGHGTGLDGAAVAGSVPVLSDGVASTAPVNAGGNADMEGAPTPSASDASRSSGDFDLQPEASEEAGSWMSSDRSPPAPAVADVDQIERSG